MTLELLESISKSVLISLITVPLFEFPSDCAIKKLRLINDGELMHAGGKEVKWDGEEAGVRG